MIRIFFELCGHMLVTADITVFETSTVVDSNNPPHSLAADYSTLVSRPERYSLVSGGGGRGDFEDPQRFLGQGGRDLKNAFLQLSSPRRVK